MSFPLPSKKRSGPTLYFNYRLWVIHTLPQLHVLGRLSGVKRLLPLCCLQRALVVFYVLPTITYCLVAPVIRKIYNPTSNSTIVDEREIRESERMDAEQLFGGVSVADVLAATFGPTTPPKAELASSIQQEKNINSVRSSNGLQNNRSIIASSPMVIPKSE
jgi:hypothetical protein